MAASSDKVNAKGIRLERHNYSRWRIEVEDALRGNGLWLLVTGEEKAVGKPVLAAGADQAAITAHGKVLKEYLEQDGRDSKARSLIRRTLDDVDFSHVQDCATAKQIMDRLRELRDPKTTDVLMTSMTGFFAEVWKENDDVSSFLARLAVHAGRVNACDKAAKITDEFVIAKTLASLPSAFTSFVSSWYLIAKAEPTMSEFREKLLTAERGMRDATGKDPFEAALSHESGDALQANIRRVRGGKRFAGPSASSANKFTGQCHYCAKKGHMKKDCQKRIADEKKNESSERGGKQSALTAFAFVTRESSSILADCGASRHLTGHSEWFKSLKKLKTPILLSTADSEIRATHVGDIDVEVSPDGMTWIRRVWQDVLLVPGMTTNLFSTTWMERRGYSFTHGQKSARLTGKGKTICTATWDGTGYLMNIRVIQPSKGKAYAASLGLWHQRLGHVSDEVVKRMVRDEAVKGMQVVGNSRHVCDGCFFGKQTANPHPARLTPRDCLPGQRLHSDVCFAATKALDGSISFVTLKDESSGYRLVALLKSTAEVHTVLENMLTRVERETGRKVISIRSDNGREFENTKVDSLLSSRGIQVERSAPHVKQGNGIAERENRILCDTARSLLYNADLSRTDRLRLWGEAILTSAYLRNRVPNKRTRDRTPFECWFGKKPDLSHLRVFGSPAFVKIPEIARKQMDPKSRKTVFVGYDPNTDKILRVFDRSLGLSGRVDRVSDVQVVDTESDCIGVFDGILATLNEEEKEGNTSDREEEKNDSVHEKGDEFDTGEEEEHGANEKKEEEEIFRDAHEQPFHQPLPPPVTFTIHATKSKKPNPRNPTHIPSHLVTRSKTKSQVTKENAKSAMSYALDPDTRDDALSRPDAHAWQAAMDEEMLALQQNETWSLCKLPPGKDMISTKWVLKSKTNPDGTLARRKARLVARGFSQTRGVDFFETFAPVVRYESVRCILSLAAANRMTVKQFDVKTAFLNGDLNEDVFIAQPDGYQDRTDRVCKLQKSLYGLKQSPRMWNEKFSKFLAGEGLHAVPEDACVYVRKRGKDLLIIALYVDDGLVCGSNSHHVNSFLNKLKSAFAVTIHDAQTYVGMEIERDSSSHAISISQSGYINRMLTRFGLADGKLEATPMSQAADLTGEDSQEVDVPYREAIGCLNYISTISRPDITFAVNKLARFSNSPKKVHWLAVKRVMRYLKGTLDYKITYANSNELVGHCDSDFAGCTTTRRSTTGYIFCLNSGPVAWSSRLQSTPAQSVTEAEYMALADALTECLWLRPFLASLGQLIDKPTALMIDNQSALNLARNPEFHKRTKHVGVKYHRVRHEQANKVVTVTYVPTEQNIADVLTKAVTAAVMEKNLPRIGFY